MPYNLPQRKSPRARWHNYTGADYFVTFCTKNRELYFGDVVNGKMELSEIGKWVQTQIEQTAVIRQNDVEIPMFVVMPNHVHMIVVFNHTAPPPIPPVCRDAPRASDDNDAPRASDDNDAPRASDNNDASLRFGPQSGNLPSIVRGIKCAVTKYANEHDIPFAWQSRYHDHIVRNQVEMNRIAEYIVTNPRRWELDKFFKKK